MAVDHAERDRQRDSEAGDGEQERRADEHEEDAAHVAADRVAVLGAAVGAVQPVADRFDRAGDRDQRDDKADREGTGAVRRREDAVQLRLDRLDDMRGKHRQRLAAQIGGKVGAAERGAGRHQEDREREEREDQRIGDGARHHHAVVAKQSPCRIAENSGNRPEPGRDGGADARQDATRLLRLNLDIRHGHQFTRLRALDSCMRPRETVSISQAPRLSHSPCIARRSWSASRRS